MKRECDRKEQSKYSGLSLGLYTAHACARARSPEVQRVNAHSHQALFIGFLHCFYDPVLGEILEHGISHQKI